VSNWPIVVAVPAVLAFLAWVVWLLFAAYIANKHGVEGLRALPPLAESFRRRPWRKERTRRNADSEEDP